MPYIHDEIISSCQVTNEQDGLQSVYGARTLVDNPQLNTMNELDVEPNQVEVTEAIKQLATGKAPGQDGIPPEVYKCGGANLITRSAKLFCAF